MCSIPFWGDIVHLFYATVVKNNHTQHLKAADCEVGIQQRSAHWWTAGEDITSLWLNFLPVVMLHLTWKPALCVCTYETLAGADAHKHEAALKSHSCAVAHYTVSVKQAAWQSVQINKVVCSTVHSEQQNGQRPPIVAMKSERGSLCCTMTI